MFGTGENRTKPLGRPARRVEHAHAGSVHLGKERAKKLRSLLRRAGGFDDLIGELWDARRNQALNKKQGAHGVQVSYLNLLLYSSNLVEGES